MRLQTVPNIVHASAVADLSQVQVLSLRNGSIAFLYSFALSQFTNLQELDLSGNLITEIPPVFAANNSLRRIVLENNQIARVYPGAFGSLQHVEYM